MLLFEWDTQKAKKNEETHGVSFDEASTAFRDNLSLTIHDPLHSDEEDRFIKICQNTPQLCWGDEWLPLSPGGRGLG